MPRVPGQEPPGRGGGAAERLRQFEQERGLEPDEGVPLDDTGDTDTDEHADPEPASEGEGDDA